jgi:2-polyprenyl-3-methyl-5-hydroxy-6-metoxy-1,4-benzoquinol methylase
MAGLITQNRFAGPWLAFQELFGGTPDKRRIALERYRGQTRVLEIGCAAGNLTPAFLTFPGLAYTGIDIDANAIDFARRRFSQQRNVRFLDVPLADLVGRGERFDYVLFAGVLHHVDDPMAVELLRSGLELLAPDGIIVVSEPEAVRPSDNILMRMFYRLEQGQYLRSAEGLARLVAAVGASITFREDRYVAPGVVSWPKVARFTLLEATRG